jgi:hypothetical protein
LKETGKFKNVYSDKLAVVLPPGRAFMVRLSRPDPTYGKFGINILYDKLDKTKIPALKALQAEFKRLVDFKYPKGAPAILTRPAVQDGDKATDKEGNLLKDKYKYYANTYFIAIGCKDPIRTVSGAKDTLKDIPAETIMNGCIVDGTAQCLLYGEGCSWQGRVIRLVKDDGTRYNIGPDSAAMLDVLDGEEQSLEQAADEVLGDETVVEEVKEEVPVAPAKKAAKNGKQVAISEIL